MTGARRDRIGGPRPAGSRRGVRLAVVLLLAWGAAACWDGVSPLLTNVAVALLEPVEGDGQMAPAGTTLPVAPTVRAFDQNGDPIEGARVIFAVTAGGGSVTEDTVVTDEDGVASAGAWTLGTAAGLNEVEVMAPETDTPPFVFEATGLPGPAADVVAIAGDGQTAPVGGPVAIPPAVRVVDAHGNGVPGVPVTFEVIRGEGTATGTEAVTDSAGAAAVGGWTLGTESGEQALAAVVAELGEVRFTVTATAGSPSELTRFAGDGQTAVAGSAVATPPSVLVSDGYGNPVPGVAVAFAVTGGGGAVEGAEATTGADGVAAVAGWTLGTAAGANELTATVAGLDPAVFTATAEPGAPSSMVKIRGDGQTAAAGTQVPIAPAVRVEDVHGNGVAGVAVTFAVTGGGGSATGTAAVTDDSGEAAVGGWTLGTTPGPNTLAADVDGLAAVEFAATGTAGAPASLVKVSGDAQAATVGTAVATAPTVRVADAFGNAVAGATVTFTVTAGGGSVTGAEAVTDGDGLAAVGSWTLGTTAGAQTLSAAVSGVDPAVFTATAQPGPAAGVVKARGDGQSAPVGTAVAVPPAVRVVDAFGNGVAGVAVTFAVTGGGGSAAGLEATTDAAGEAAVGSWTLGTTPGANTLSGSAEGLGAVEFTATATAGPPAGLAAVAGDGQSATVGTAVATAPAVRVTDAYGNPVPGVTVTFAVTGGGGAVTGATAVTDAVGVATVGSWTLGTVAGANTLSASAAGVTAVGFTATGTAGAPATVTIQAGQDQTAAAGTAVAIDPAVVVTDAYGNPASGVSVTFTVTGGAGSVAGSPATTDANGVATVVWTLGDPGANTMDAAVTGLTPVTFSATAS